MQAMMMFTYLDDLPGTARAIGNMLEEGWTLFSLNEDKANFVRPDDSDIERFAIRCAKGNNGGEWATHHTEEQKEVWRQFVADLYREMIDFRGKSP